MTDSQGPMLRAVSAALREAQPDKQDAGAVALCRNYARLIDNAAPAAKYRKALTALGYALEDASPKAVEAFDVVRDALAAHSVASDLGPKLLAALTALGLTVSGRGAETKGTGGDSSTPGSPLDGLRDEVGEQRAKRGTG